MVEIEKLTPVKQVNNSGQWQPGRSGNPDGRPKKGQTLTNALRNCLEVYDKRSKKTKKEMFIETIVKLALEGNIAAIKLIWSYADGLPIQRQEVIEKSGEEEKEEEDSCLKRFSPDDRKLIKEYMNKGMADGFVKATLLIYGRKDPMKQ